MSDIKLTEYSSGSGCGCKIAPQVLEQILSNSEINFNDEKLLIGYYTKDDAAVYELDNENALISTVDFFTPIVDDPYDFGQIAAANALSDVYAMGGKPLLATAILGWPVNKIDPTVAKKVIEGARETCASVSVSIAGGHSIDSPEPFFGLSVNGLVKKSNLKTNCGAKEGDVLFLTKPLGSGILSSAFKKGVLANEHQEELIATLKKVNNLGEKIGELSFISAMTDITGFGLLGHLIELCEGASLSAEIFYSNIALMSGLQEYIAKGICPDNLYRNWNSFQNKIEGISHESFLTLSDPQTNGGLLIAVNENKAEEFKSFLALHGLSSLSKPVGKLIPKFEKSILVK
ncbi:MAG: selenide, water dikinase SelD [Flavobacteriales bacterium]|nr:selenide, water dikinase SelD [Flavobacteriales bacterium]